MPYRISHMIYENNMSDVNGMSFVNDMSYVNNMISVNEMSCVNNMSYVKRYELRHELCKLYQYCYKSLKIK